MKLSQLFRHLSLALIWLSSFLCQHAFAYDAEDVPQDFRGTFVNCMAKGQADPLSGRDYAQAWLRSEAGGEVFARFCLAVWTFQSGEPRLAAGLLENLAEHSDVRETKYELSFYSLAGELYDSVQAYEAAFRAHSKALDLNRFEPELWVNRAIVRASLGDLEGTLSDLDLALALDADNLDALIFRGSTFLAIDEMEKAADDALAALLLDPFNASGLWLRAQVALEEGDLDLARKDLARILQRESGALATKAEDTLRVLDAAAAAAQKSTLE